MNDNSDKEFKEFLSSIGECLIDKRVYEEINWYGQEPEHFPCLLCEDNKAKVFRHIGGMNLPICHECNKLSDAELLAMNEKRG